MAMPLIQLQPVDPSQSIRERFCECGVRIVFSPILKVIIVEHEFIIKHFLYISEIFDLLQAEFSS